MRSRPNTFPSRGKEGVGCSAGTYSSNSHNGRGDNDLVIFIPARSLLNLSPLRDLERERRGGGGGGGCLEASFLVKAFNSLCNF